MNERNLARSGTAFGRTDGKADRSRRQTSFGPRITGLVGIPLAIGLLTGTALSSDTTTTATTDTNAASTTAPAATSPPAAATTPAASTGGNATTAAAGSNSHDDLIKRGEYLTIAGDCAACHTGPGMPQFAGGLMMETPFGGISTPNLTPDDETGLGKWTEEDFWRTLHLGIGKDGEYIYPAMPYTSFTKVQREDVDAIFAYLQSLEPVNAPRKPNTMGFPFNIREGLAAWNLMFFRAGVYQANADWSDEVNRGAYLVQGLAHCAECHAPRNIAGGITNADDYSGGKILGQPWYAPDISGGTLHEGISDWSIDTIAEYLKTGAAKGKGTAFGPMEDAVTHSFSKLTDDDLKAIAEYLKTVPSMAAPVDPVADARKKQGAELYINNCAACHQSTGLGIASVIPPLDGNGAVTTADPTNIITVLLAGLQGHGTYGHMPAFGAQFDDQQIADIANFVRTSWSNKASANATPEMVARLREQVVPVGAASEAARAFGCPAVSETGAQDAIAYPGAQIMQGFRGVTNAEMGSRVNVLLNEVKAQNPKASDAEIVNVMMAAYCPVVAEDDNLTTPEKKDRLDTFLKEVDSILGRGQMPAGSRVLVQVPLPPDVVTAVDAAAKAANESRRDWLEKVIEDQASTAAPATGDSGSAN